MKITSVDEFVRLKISPELQVVATHLRQRMRAWAPQASEEISYGILAWRVNLIVAVLSPTKKDLTLAFSRGAEFEDKYGLLQGVGKISRHLKLSKVKTINQATLRYYVKQALQIEARRAGQIKGAPRQAHSQSVSPKADCSPKGSGGLIF
jgi:hypothetical protein